MRLTIRGWRSVIECISLTFLTILHGFLENVILTPELFNFFLAVDKVHVRINFVVHNCLLKFSYELKKARIQ